MDTALKPNKDERHFLSFSRKLFLSASSLISTNVKKATK